jgi:pimeloyl-ACP methyl ester carboxylesterase
MNALNPRQLRARIVGGIVVNVSSLRISSLNVIPRGTSTRSPVIAIVGSLAAGAFLAGALVLGPASGGTEPMVTGSVLFAFGLGWALMAVLTTRFSAQPQTWMAVPAAFLGSIGLGLIVCQPGPAVMDLISWVWPPALAILAIWMFAQVRHQLRGRGRWFVVPVIATLLVFAIGGAIATVSAANGLGAPSQTGRLIDVGGHRLYIECTGTGSPVVVLQSGLGESSSYWGRIAPALAPSTTVCAYDRAGHGRSDPVAAPQDGIALATDLHTLLERADVPGPYVLVGHSSGGPYVRAFAARYPDQIAGMVLLDAQPADAFTALPDYPTTYPMLRTVYSLSQPLARIGLVGPILGLPVDQSTPAAARGARDEIVALPAALQQALAFKSLGDRPLIVITAGSGQQAGWLEAQDRLPALSSNSSHRLLPTATHTSIISGVDAEASSQAILDVVSSFRTGTTVR